MPRKPGVYRNIKRYEVTALAVSLKDGKTFTDTYYTPIIKDKNQLLKYLQKEYNNSKMVVVKVKKVVEKEKKYFLSIESYLKYAKELEE